MAEFNYTIPIPQPNTNMFGGGLFQGLQAIEGIRAARAQQALAQQLAPLEFERAQLGVQSQRQQMAQSEAAASREEARFGEFTKQQEADRNLAIALSEGKSPAEIAKLMPFASPGFVAKFPEVAQANMASSVGPIIQQGGPKSPEDIQTMKDAITMSLMLSPERAQMFQRAFSSAPDPIKTDFVKQVTNIGAAGFNGDNKTALRRLEDYATALSNNPQTQELGGVLQNKLKYAKTAEKQGLLDKTTWFLELSSLAQSIDPQAAKPLTDLAENAFKFAKTGAETEKEQLAVRKAQRELDAPVSRPLNAVDEKILTEKSTIPVGFASDTYDVLDRLNKTVIPRAGLPARIEDFFKAAAFGGDEITKLRTDINAILTSDSFRKYASFTKGSTSDNDAKIAKSFNIKATSDPKLVKEALSAIINTAERARRVEDVEKEWAKEIGMINKAKDDMDILGVPVRKGQSYAAFKENVLRQLDKVNFVEEIARQKTEDEDEMAKRKEISAGMKGTPLPDFTNSEEDSLLRAADVLKRLKR